MNIYNFYLKRSSCTACADLDESSSCIDLIISIGDNSSCTLKLIKLLNVNRGHNTKIISDTTEIVYIKKHEFLLIKSDRSRIAYTDNIDEIADYSWSTLNHLTSPDGNNLSIYFNIGLFKYKFFNFTYQYNRSGIFDMRVQGALGLYINENIYVGDCR